MAEKKGCGCKIPEMVIQGVKPGSKEEEEILRNVKQGKGSIKGGRGKPWVYEEKKRETH